MAVDEAARHQLYRSLESTLGPEPTSTLMSLLPPVGWADVATRQDLHALENGLRSEIAELRAEMHREISGVRGEISGVRGEIAELRAEMHTTIRNAVFSMIGAMFTLAALTVAATTVA